MADDKWGAGDRSNWTPLGRSVKVGNARYELIRGENPHSRSDSSTYAIVGDEAVPFSGHHNLIGMTFAQTNRLKESGLSGDDIRGGGFCQITSDGEVVFEFAFQDYMYALTKAAQLLVDLREHPSDWLSSEARARLVGRKVYYNNHPAIVERLVTDQGCVILRPEGGKFPKLAYQQEDGEDYDDDEDGSIKVEVTDKYIWWHRDSESTY